MKFFFFQGGFFGVLGAKKRQKCAKIDGKSRFGAFFGAILSVLRCF
jgi:hypothetical protein